MTNLFKKLTNANMVEESIVSKDKEWYAELEESFKDIIPGEDEATYSEDQDKIVSSIIDSIFSEADSPVLDTDNDDTKEDTKEDDDGLGENDFGKKSDEDSGGDEGGDADDAGDDAGGDEGGDDTGDDDAGDDAGDDTGDDDAGDDTGDDDAGDDDAGDDTGDEGDEDSLDKVKADADILAKTQIYNDLVASWSLISADYNNISSGADLTTPGLINALINSIKVNISDKKYTGFADDIDKLAQAISRVDIAITQHKDADEAGILDEKKVADRKRAIGRVNSANKKARALSSI